MCGIVAHLHPGGADRLGVDAATRALHHRGPDGSGIYNDPLGRLALGHSRLAVIAPDDGAQPIANETGEIVVVTNGEFYGFEAQRRALRKKGHRFRTGSDAEIALHLYEEHGLDFVDHLRGEFTFILWDARDGTLVCGRDRFGVRPLCYGERGGGLWIASEAKALFAAGFPAVWNWETLYHATCLQYPLPSQTFFRDIHQLPPGHLLVTRAGQAPVLSRYWDLRFPEPGLCEDAVEQFQKAFDDAVKTRLRADAPLAIQLSGGVDSNAVLSTAARHASGPLDAFTVSFDDPDYDELEITQSGADHVGARLHPVCLTRDDLADHLEEAVVQGEGVAINTHISAKYLLAKEIAARGFKVVLTGEGADEMLLGYSHLRKDAQPGHSQLPATSGHFVTAGVHLPSGPQLPTRSIEEALGTVPTFIAAKSALGYRIHRVLCGEFRQRFVGWDPCRAVVDQLGLEQVSRDPVRVAQYAWSKLGFCGYILRILGDGMEAAHGIEGRLPFVDHGVAEALARVASAQLTEGPIEKPILREAMKDRLPPHICSRPKHPFMAPRTDAGARTQALIDDWLRSPKLRELPCFDACKVHKLLDERGGMSPPERVATDPVVMIALSAAILHHRYGMTA